MDFLKIIKTTHGRHFWSVPSQFLILWSPGCKGKIFYVSTTLWKGFNVNIHVVPAEEWLKVRVKKRKLKLSSGQKTKQKKIVRTGNPMYLGTQQKNIFLSKVT